jgi:hypothetical protein
MGLDTYASRTEGDVELTPEDEEAFTKAGIELCGGMYSGEGGSSFRGKVYLDVVDRVADVWLSQDWIPPEEVRRIWVAFERADEDVVVEESKGDHYPVTVEEVENLRAFFRVCAERGLGLIGWY